MHTYPHGLLNPDKTDGVPSFCRNGRFITVLLLGLLFSFSAHAYKKPANFDTTVLGGVVYSNAMVNTTVNSVGKFSYNKARKGGVLYNAGGTVTFDSVTKFNNNAATAGGGVFYAGSRINLTKATEFVANSGGSAGGMAQNDTVNNANALWFNIEPVMTGNTGGTYSQTYTHCYVGTEKRDNCCPADKPYFYSGACHQCPSGNTFFPADGICCPTSYSPKEMNCSDILNCGQSCTNGKAKVCFRRYNVYQCSHRDYICLQTIRSCQGKLNIYLQTDRYGHWNSQTRALVARRCDSRDTLP